MKSLFEKEVREELVQRIEKVSADQPPLWGKMNASQMLAHCNVAFRTALGEEESKRSLIGLLIGPLAKIVLYSSKPFGKNLPTAKNFIMQGDKNFEREKAVLIGNVQKFSEGGEKVVSKGPHPLFGKMNIKEWDRLMYKHLDHHLRQFGV